LIQIKAAEFLPYLPALPVLMKKGFNMGREGRFFLFFAKKMIFSVLLT